MGAYHNALMYLKVIRGGFSREFLLTQIWLESEWTIPRSVWESQSHQIGVLFELGCSTAKRESLGQGHQVQHWGPDHWAEYVAICSSRTRTNRVCLDNVKALFRRGKAHHNDKNLDAAEADLEAALRVEPNNADVVQELRRVREKMKAHKEKEKQKFAGFFDKLADD